MKSNKFLDKELIKIQEYINQNFKVENEIGLYYGEKSIIIYAKKYYLILRLVDKKEKNYLKNEYGISFGFKEKKLYYGGGSLEKYDPEDYSNIKRFLEDKIFKIPKVKYYQTTIFD